MTNLRPKPPGAERTARDSRATPPELFAVLDAEFRFTLDPCPLDTSPIAGAPLWGRDGTAKAWDRHRVFCNPPYSDVAPWLRKAREADVAVYLLPVKSDVPWWHDYVMSANEVRFIRGRVRFGGMSGGAPFASAVVVFTWGHDPSAGTRYLSMDRPPRPAAAK